MSRCGALAGGGRIFPLPGPGGVWLARVGEGLAGVGSRCVALAGEGRIIPLPGPGGVRLGRVVEGLACDGSVGPL